MADRTDFADFTRLSPSDPLSTDNYGLQDRNLTLLDYYLRLIWTGERDGHGAMDDPTLDPTATAYNAGGQIPSDLSLSVGYTLLDNDGGETALSPLLVVDTQAGLVAPDDAPVLAYSNLAGALMANTYSYALTLTDGLGGETALGPPSTVVVPSGQPTNQITLSNLDMIAGAQGAAGWRLWRSVGGEDWHLIAQGTDAEGIVVDDGSLTADCGVNPPSVTGTTRATNRLGVTVPGGQPPEAVSFRIYAAIDGAFDSPSLLATYAMDQVDIEQVFTELTYLPNIPPETSTTMPAVPGGGGGGPSLPGYPETVVLPLHGPDFYRQASDNSMYAVDPVASRSYPMPFDAGEDRLVVRPENDYSYNGEQYGIAMWHVEGDVKQQAAGSVTLKFQFPEDPGQNINVRVGLATVPGFSHLIAEYQATDMSHFLSVSTYDPTNDGGETWQDIDTNSSADNFDRPIDINADLWLRLTVNGLNAKAELFDVDPTTPGAIPWLSFTGVAKTLTQVRSVVYGGLPSFGWYNGFDFDKLRLYELSATAQAPGAVTPPSSPSVAADYLDLPITSWGGGAVQWSERGDFGTLYASIRPVVDAFGPQYESDVQDFSNDNALNTEEFKNVTLGTGVAGGYLTERGDLNQYAAAEWAKAGLVPGDFSWVVKGNRPTAGQQGGMLTLRAGDVEAWDIPTGVTMYGHAGPGILIRTGQFPAPATTEYWSAHAAAAVGDVWWVVSRTAGVWRFERWSTDPALGGAPDVFVESPATDAWYTLPVALRVQGQYWRAQGGGTFQNPAINILQLDELRLSRQARKVRLVATAVAEDGAGGFLPAVEADLVSGA